MAEVVMANGSEERKGEAKGRKGRTKEGGERGEERRWNAARLICWFYVKNGSHFLRKSKTPVNNGLEAAGDLGELSTTRVVWQNGRTLVVDAARLGLFVIAVGRGRRRERRLDF